MIKALFKVCAPLPRSVGASRLEEDPTREGRLSILGRPELDLGVAPQPAPRTSLLQSKNSYTGSVGCLASSPRETWTSPKSFRSFLEQREAALVRRSRGPSLGSIHEGSWTGTQDCRRPPNDQETNKGRNESDSKYRVLEQKVIELEDQVEEMQMSRWDYQDSTARLAGFLSGFASQLSLAGENGSAAEWRSRREEEEEGKDGGFSYSALPPRQVCWRQNIMIFCNNYLQLFTFNSRQVICFPPLKESDRQQSNFSTLPSRRKCTTAAGKV